MATVSRHPSRGGGELLHLVSLAPTSTAFAAVWAVMAALVQLAVPAATARAVDRALSRDAPGHALTVLVALLAARVLAEACGEVSQGVARTQALARLRNQLLLRVFAMGVVGQRRYPAGDVLTRMSGNAATAAASVPTLVSAVVATATSLGGMVALWLIDWWIALVFLAGMVPASMSLRRLVERVSACYVDYLERLAAIAARLTDALAGSRTIRASGSANVEVRRVLALLPALSRSGTTSWAAQRTAAWRVGLVLVAIRVLALMVAGLSYFAGRISAGEFLGASLYLSVALGVLGQADNLLRIGDARANARRVLDVLVEDSDARAPARSFDVRQLSPGLGRLLFDGVCVSLGGRVVLERVTLELPPGAAVALVGRSGAGKSTLAMLAGGLLEPDEGSVLLDGVRIDRLDPIQLRREIAYAFDRPVLLGGTVAEALGFGSPEVTLGEIERATRVAQADDFVRRLPDGIDTPLEAAPLSGGELQRLGLARAIAHGGRVLVLDDATSSLDTVTEARLGRALTEGLVGRTRLVVAHRATTAARADLVAWLDGGRIRRVAPHRQLWAEEPAYRAAFAAPYPDEESA